MKNLAIIIGITDYEDTAMLLPACRNDVSVMEQVCRAGGRFEDVITIESADSETLKGRLADVVDRFGQEDIGSLLFYFTGHGDYVDEDFRYQLRDYDSSRLAQTSLSNSELDGMLHSLSPNILIKVVDACYSGIQYIKDGTSISSYLADEIKGAFPRCYFFFSSQSDQKSYADSDISDFTAAFANAVVTSNIETVRFKHVIDFISDSFASRQKQVPQFVVQAAFTEVLGEYSSAAKENIKRTLEKDKQTIIDPDNTVGEGVLPSEVLEPAQIEVRSLAQIARESAHRHVSVEDAKRIVGDLQQQLSSMALSGDLDELYCLEKNFSERYLDMPNEGVLGRWLETNAAGEYFAAPTHGTETYEVPRLSMGNMLGLVGGVLAYTQPTTTKTRKFITGINSMPIDVPFLTYVSTFSPKLPNLLKYKGWFTFLISKTTIQIFYCFAEYREVSWAEFDLSTTSDWMGVSYSLASREGIPDVSQSFQKALFEWIDERTRARLATLLNSSD